MKKTQIILNKLNINNLTSQIKASFKDADLEVIKTQSNLNTTENNSYLNLLNLLKYLKIKDLNIFYGDSSFSIKDINIITCISKSNLDKERKLLFGSIFLYINNLNSENIYNLLLFNKIFIREPVIHIKIVSNTLEDYTKKEYELEYTKFLIIETYNYFSFFKDIKQNVFLKNKELGDPIIIFKGFHYSIIRLFFFINGYSLHSGSSTLRHKLTYPEYKLSQFLYQTNITLEDKNLFHLGYIENILSSNNFNKNLYKNIKNKLNLINNRSFLTATSVASQEPIILEFLQFNNLILTDLLLNRQKEENLEINNKISKLTSDLSTESNSNNSNKELEFSSNINYQIKKNKIIISNLTNELEKEKLGTQHRNNKKNKINELKNINKELISNNFMEKVEKSKNINNIKNELIKLNEKKDRLEKEINKNEEVFKNEYLSIQNLGTNFFNVKLKNRNITYLNTGSGSFGGESNNFNNRSFSNNAVINKNIRFYSTAVASPVSTGTINKKLNLNTNSILFIELKRLLYLGCSEENQFKIENYLKQQGSIFLEDKFNLESNINYYKINPFIDKEIKKAIPLLEKLIDNKINNYITNKIKNKKYYNEKLSVLANINSFFIIEILLGRFLRIISNNKLINNNTKATNIFIDSGKELVWKYIESEYKKLNLNKKTYTLSKFKLENQDIFNKYLDDNFLFYLGSEFFHLLEEVNLVVLNVSSLDKDEKISHYNCSNEISKFITPDFLMLDMPYKLPMICKPKEYNFDVKNKINKLGGYLLNDKNYLEPLIIENKELLKPSLIEEQNIIYNTINKLSSVGYKINSQVLNFILNRGLEFNIICDPNWTHPLEEKLIKNKKLSSKELKELDSYNSKKQLELNVLGIAQLYNDVKNIYFPLRIDNRGRIYCENSYLNYQGIDLAKSLLLFSEGEKIYKTDNKAIEFLKIFGANAFGLDKLSFKERIQWVEDNEDKIINFENGELLKKAESKCLFIAFCFEYIHYIESLNNNFTYYISNFPIQLDATCNGYQHLSLLIGEDKLAEKLNLIPSNFDNAPADFYSYITIKLKHFLTEKIKEEGLDLELKKSYTNLLKLPFSRNLVKTAIMVKPYNASDFKVVDYFKEHFYVEKTDNKYYYFYIKDNNIKLSIKDLFNLSTTINYIIYVEYPKLKDFMNYLQSISNICSVLNLPILWSVPSGLKVNQFYLKNESIRLKPFSYKKNTFALKIRTKELNKDKQRRALMPNLIHSLDATSLFQLVNAFYEYKLSQKEFKDLNFYAIHDCFAVTANNISKIFILLKLVYIDIYCNNTYIKNFDRGIKNYIKFTLGSDVFFEKDTKTYIRYANIELEYPSIDKIIREDLKIKETSILNSNYLIN